MAGDRMLRRLTTILAADVAGYSRLAGADEEGTVARLRALRSELIDPAIAANRGRIRQQHRRRDPDRIRERRRCDAPCPRGPTPHGVHLGDVIVESDGDLMGDAVNIAARLEGISEPGGTAFPARPMSRCATGE